MPAVNPQQYRPKSLDLKLNEQMLEITWADGVAGRLPAKLLRRECPCAACQTGRQQQQASLLPILQSPLAGEVRVTGGHLVGNYAIQLDFSDGHNTGIYDFRLLRSLCT